MLTYRPIIWHINYIWIIINNNNHALKKIALIGKTEKSVYRAMALHYLVPKFKYLKGEFVIVKVNGVETVSWSNKKWACLKS